MANAERCLWIGGTSRAGKTTAARILSRRHGLRCYSVDTATWSHRDRAVADGDASARAWQRLTPQQRAGLSATEHLALDHDRSRYVLEDVEALPDHPPVVVEGTAIVPSLPPDGSVAVWLIASPATRAARTATRGWGDGGGDVDLLRAAALHDQLLASDSVVIDTTDHPGPLDTVRILEASVRPWLLLNPGVTAATARAELRRDANRAVLEQHRAGWRHHHRAPDHAVVRALECECADPDCVDFVEVAIAALPDPFDRQSAPVLADGHAGP